MGPIDPTDDQRRAFSAECRKCEALSVELRAAHDEADRTKKICDSRVLSALRAAYDAQGAYSDACVTYARILGRCSWAVQKPGMTIHEVEAENLIDVRLLHGQAHAKLDDLKRALQGA